MADSISEELRAAIARRAEHRCEYCLISAGDAGFSHQVDHIVSRKHGGLSMAENLAYACMLCNRYKGADIASLDSLSGKLVQIFNPRTHRWADHFQIQGEFIEPLTDVGRVTVRLLRLNRAERVAERRLLQALGSYPRRCE